jgi:L-asparagine transporter-like permease
MSHLNETDAGAAASDARADSFAPIMSQEAGLHRTLSARKLSMIAIGGAIGTGLFLGSGFAISIAGPAVLVSYVIGALIALLLMGCLAEMAVAHPTTGSFGAYAEHYVGPLAGFLVRYAYWSCLVLAVGTEVTALALYMQYWFPAVAGWIWILAFSMLLIGVNARSVSIFGSIEYTFSLIKLTAIAAFILLASAVLLSNALRPGGAAGSADAIGFHNYLAHGGFLPHGMWGLWVAVIMAIFSYLSIEMIAVAAGEAAHPQTAIVRAFRATLVRLVVFYLLTLALMLAILPWTQAGVGASPFVLVMQTLRIPAAASVMNAVLLVAALSAMNSQLYISTRMLFSLARAGQAPRSLGTVSARGTPRNALLVSTAGIALAASYSVRAPLRAYLSMVAISSFGAMFTWFMIFVTHYCFRRERRARGLGSPGFSMWGYPATTLAGAGAMLALLLTTPFTVAFRMTLLFGLPFLLCLVAIYLILGRPRSSPTAGVRAGPQETKIAEKGSGLVDRAR